MPCPRGLATTIVPPSACFDDPCEPERWNPKLKLIKEILLTREPEVAESPLALRLITRLAAYSTAWSRRRTTVCAITSRLSDNSPTLCPSPAEESEATVSQRYAQS